MLKYMYEKNCKKTPIAFSSKAKINETQGGVFRRSAGHKNRAKGSGRVYHEAGDVLKEEERDVPLAAELNEMGRWEPRGRVILQGDWVGWVISPLCQAKLRGAVFIVTLSES